LDNAGFHTYSQVHTAAINSGQGTAEFRVGVVVSCWTEFHDNVSTSVHNNDIHNRTGEVTVLVRHRNFVFRLNPWQIGLFNVAVFSAQVCSIRRETSECLFWRSIAEVILALRSYSGIYLKWLWKLWKSSVGVAGLQWKF